MSKTLKIECVSNSHKWAELGHQLKPYLESDHQRNIFLTWSWLKPWIEVYGKLGALLVLIARDPDTNKIIGVAPMFIHKTKSMPGAIVRRLGFLGQWADTAAEYLEWIITPGEETRVSNAFWEALHGPYSHCWDVLELSAMHEASPTVKQIKLLAEKSSQLETDLNTEAPYVSLPTTWNDFLSQRSSNFRQRWNQFHKKHTVRILEAGKDIPITEALQIVAKLNSLRWGNNRQSFLSRDYNIFHQKLATLLSESNRLLMHFLEVDGDIIACRYDFSYAGKAWCFQGGWDPKWEKSRPGRLMLGYVIKESIQQGLSEYDFLGGRQTYKDEWSHGKRTIINLKAVNPRSFRGRFFAKLQGIRKRLKEGF